MSPLCILISYAYLKTAGEQLASLPTDWSYTLDSGAFTNFTKGRDVYTLEGYIDFCLEHGDRFAHVVNMDRIGDAEVSAENLRVMLNAGVKNVMPVFQRGGSAAQLRELCNAGHPLIGIGGVAHTAKTASGIEYIESVMQITRDEGQAVHLLGVSSVQKLAALQPVSADSSSWSAFRRFGQLRLWHGNRFVGFTVKDRPSAPKTAALRAYGLTWAHLKDPEAVPRYSQKYDGFGPLALAEVRSYIRMAWALKRFSSVDYVFSIGLVDVPLIEEAWRLERHNWGWR